MKKNLHHIFEHIKICYLYCMKEKKTYVQIGKSKNEITYMKLNHNLKFHLTEYKMNVT